VISSLKTERGLALQDLVTGAYEFLDTIELKPHARAYLLDALATTEYVHFSMMPLLQSSARLI
jgi:replication factor C subunit 3/5